MVMQNTRLRSIYLFEGQQSRGRALPAHVNAAEHRKVCITLPAVFKKHLATVYMCGIRKFWLKQYRLLWEGCY